MKIPTLTLALPAMCGILLPLLLGGCAGFRVEGQLEYAGKTVTIGQGADGKTVMGLRAHLGDGKGAR